MQDKLSLDKLLPHAEPMILLTDYDLSDSADSICAHVDITANSPFFESALGGVPSCVSLEYMAQAMALFTGISRLRNNMPPQMGFILGSRRLVNNIPFFKLGNRYSVKVVRTYSDESFGSFDCSIYDSSDVCVASGVLTAFQPGGNLTPDKLEEYK